MAPTAVLTRLREICLALPEVSEKTSWGHPNFRAGRKMFAAYEVVKGRPSIAFRLLERSYRTVALKRLTRLLDER